MKAQALLREATTQVEVMRCEVYPDPNPNPDPTNPDPTPQIPTLPFNLH